MQYRILLELTKSAEADKDMCRFHTAGLVFMPSWIWNISTPIPANHDIFIINHLLATHAQTVWMIQTHQSYKPCETNYNGLALPTVHSTENLFLVQLQICLLVQTPLKQCKSCSTKWTKIRLALYCAPLHIFLLVNHDQPHW